MHGGGAVAVSAPPDSDLTLTIVDSSFADNAYGGCSLGGGAVVVALGNGSHGLVSLSTTQFVDNRAEVGGGAVAVTVTPPDVGSGHAPPDVGSGHAPPDVGSGHAPPDVGSGHAPGDGVAVIGAGRDRGRQHEGLSESVPVVAYCSLTAADCVFEGNSAGDAAGQCVLPSYSDLTGGGAVLVQLSSAQDVVQVSNCTFRENTVTALG